MLSYLLNLISGFSIGLAAIIGMVRFKKISAIFRPFVYLLWIGFFSELLSFFFAMYFRNNLAIGNIYVLIESIFLLWQFSNWKGYKLAGKKYLLIGIGFFAIWLTDNVFMHRITETNSLFRVAYCFVIVFLSIEQINLVFLSERNSISKNASFLICGAFIVFFAFRAIFEVFYMINVRMSDHFYNTLYFLLITVNLFTNIIYAVATLWIPKKLKFSLPL